MNKPIIVAMAVLAVFFSATAVSVPVLPAAYAQYGVEGSPVAGATEEQIAECDQYGIPRAECTENAILAKRRLIYAQENPSTGSGTSMLSTDAGSTWLYIGVLAAIFGGVAAAFFFRGRGHTPPT